MLGNLQTVKALQRVINKEDPAIIFLMEMKSDLDWMVKVRDWCKFKNGLIVSNRGKNGGLGFGR